ncbi:MAG: hypothetical protein QM791_01490 [Ferruginibacter sp.]
MEQDEFYIGWQPKAPLSFAAHVKRVLRFIMPAAIITALLTASFQKRFSRANFEFGTVTTVKGIYIAEPVPMLKVIAGKDLWGNAAFITIPLVGYGKHGAATAIKEIESEKGISLSNREVTLKGTLLYGSGKTWLQVNKEDNPVVNIGNTAGSSLLPVKKDLGNLVISGEIIDPKCYFGVMKPGEGKVHRDCATRCILGGIPPVLKVRDEKGVEHFYLIAGSGRNVSDIVKDYIAEPVAVHANLVQQDDWDILYINSSSSIARISKREMLQPGLVAMNCVSNCCK